MARPLYNIPCYCVHLLCCDNGGARVERNICTLGCACLLFFNTHTYVIPGISLHICHDLDILFTFGSGLSQKLIYFAAWYIAKEKVVSVFVAFCSFFSLFLKSCLSKVILKFKEIVCILLSVMNFGQACGVSGEEAHSLARLTHI